tara:strand:+ start:4822 stop:6795 length:1974 start_codon:yes stop_codon:yes gene_type:complete
MADEDKGLSAKEQQSLVTKILTELRRSTAETTKGQENARKTFEEKLDNLDGVSDELKTIGKQAGMLEQSFGFTKEAALSIAKTTDALELTKKRMEEMESIAEQTGQDVQNSAEFKRLEIEKKSLEEQQKFGRNLSSFERGFVKFAGGTFEEMKKSLQEGGNLTQRGIIGEGLSDLKGDFDKVLAFLGPVGGFLQQIPLLGTILNFIGRQMKAVLVRLVLSAKERLIDGKKQNAIDTANLKIAQKGLKTDEQMVRNQTKQSMVQGTTTTAAGSDGGDSKQDDNRGGASFRAASVFLLTAAATGVTAGAGLTAAAAGMSAFATSAFKFAGALAVGGLALGVGLTGIFGSFALGDKMGAFEGMQEFGKVNMLKVLGSMLGLATLMGVLGAIVTTGVGALIMGVGAIAVMALIGTLVVIGKGLGEFAEGILPFESMNVPRIKHNIQQLATISEDIDTLMSLSSGRSFMETLFTNHPLADLADALSGYEQDMSIAINNLDQLKTALTDFKIPDVPPSDRTVGAFFRGIFGEDFSGELKKISGVTVTQELGNNIGKLGEGLAKMGAGLKHITDDDVRRLDSVVNSIDDLAGHGKHSKGVVLNFINEIAPANLTPPEGEVTTGTNNNVNVQPMVSNNVSNITRKFSATGSNMMNHSALHYPSLQ